MVSLRDAVDPSLPPAAVYETTSCRSCQSPEWGMVCPLVNVYGPGMGTKAPRTDHIRCLARLISQCRVNAGDAASLGRSSEAKAWREVGESLAEFARWVHARGSRDSSLWWTPDEVAARR